MWLKYWMTIFISTSYTQASRDLSNFHSMCKYLNVPVAHHKTEEPVHCLAFLGIELNTELRTAKLPKDKLKEYSEHVTDRISRRKCTLREFKSILGKVQFSTAVIPAGKGFLRRMYNATIGKTNLNNYVNLTGN